MLLPGDVSAGWPKPVRALRAIVAIDVVESVRLLRDYEDDVIDRWRRFVNEVRSEVLPPQGGRLVKSLGDGMLLEFGSVVSAVKTALEVHRRIQAYNAGRVPAATLHVRAGVHEAEIVVDDLDIYGSGVNLAARLATLAGPGETILSPTARDALVPDLDFDIEDLGNCYLKHFSEPQRAYRVGPLGTQTLMWSGAAAGVNDRVSIAVIPFAGIGESGQWSPLGEVLADDLIAQLSRLRQLHVLSRLSTTVFRSRELDLKMLTSSLGSHYVVHGSFNVGSDKVRLRAQLVRRDVPGGLGGFRPQYGFGSGKGGRVCTGSLGSLANGRNTIVVGAVERASQNQPYKISVFSSVGVAGAAGECNARAVSRRGPDLFPTGERRAAGFLTGSTKTLAGTSMAAAQVTAAVALQVAGLGNRAVRRREMIELLFDHASRREPQSALSSSPEFPRLTVDGRPSAFVLPPFPSPDH